MKAYVGYVETDDGNEVNAPKAADRGCNAWVWAACDRHARECFLKDTLELLDNTGSAASQMLPARTARTA